MLHASARDATKTVTRLVPTTYWIRRFRTELVVVKSESFLLRRSKTTRVMARLVSVITLEIAIIAPTLTVYFAAKTVKKSAWSIFAMYTIIEANSPTTSAANAPATILLRSLTEICKCQRNKSLVTEDKRMYAFPMNRL